MPPSLADLHGAQLHPAALNFQGVQTSLNQAFAAFRSNYQAAQAEFLSTDPNASPAAFTKALDTLHQTTDQLVSQLLASVEAAVTPLPGTLTGLFPSLMAQINGSFSGSLLNELNSIPATTGEKGGPDVLYPRVAAAAIDATQLAANDMLTAYWAGYLGAYQSHSTAQGFNYAQVQATINQALNTIRVNYKGAEATFLNSGEPGKPSAAAFDLLKTSTAQQIDQTIVQLKSVLAGVPAVAAGLVPLLTVQISGGFTGSLKTGLSLIPIASGPEGTTGNLFPQVSSDLLDSTQLGANNLLAVFNAGRIRGLNSAGFSVSPFVAKAPLFSLAQLFQLDRAGAAVHQAYAQFQSAYASAITEVLYANATPGGSGPVDLTGNQAAFNARVATALGALNNALAATLGPYASAANHLLPSIRQSLIGTGAGSLQNQLAALAIPTDLFGPTTVRFLNRSNSLIVASYLDTITRLNGTVQNPGFNFAGFTRSASFLNGPFGIQLLSKPFGPAPLGALVVSSTTGVTV